MGFQGHPGDPGIKGCWHSGHDSGLSRYLSQLLSYGVHDTLDFFPRHAHVQTHAKTRDLFRSVWDVSIRQLCGSHCQNHVHLQSEM